MKQKALSEDTIVKYLLEEFRLIEGGRVRLRGEAIQRLNIFLTLTSALLGGLIIFGQSQTSIRSEYAFIAVITFLLTIGWQAFRYIIVRDINSDRVLRAGGRIRRYFSERNIEIKKYVTWQDHDEPSRYVSMNDSAIRRTSVNVVAFLLALELGIIAFLFAHQVIFAIIIGFLTFVASIVYFEAYAQRKFKEAFVKAEEEVRLPKA